jgi:hypothetical protein
MKIVKIVQATILIEIVATPKKMNGIVAKNL